ncbi:MAG: PIN domain-containing protein [Desulfobacteraceae bacterium]|nr:PIN domain-containing protein [Desulfobacteraceae bacterium]
MNLGVNAAEAIEDLTAMLAIAASKLSLEHGIPMADSIILATAKAFDAVIWTQDSDFKNIGAPQKSIGRKKAVWRKECYYNELKRLPGIICACSTNLWNNAINRVKMHNCSLFTGP